jgi:hypothetical protein
MNVNNIIVYDDILRSYEHLISTKSFRFRKHSNEVMTKNKKFMDQKIYIEEEKLCNNSFFVSNLRDSLLELQSITCSFTPNRILSDLFNIFEKLYPEETKEIIKFKDIFSEEKIYLESDVQSGKTIKMILTSIFYLICGKDVIFILRNKKADKYQLINKFKDIFERLKNEKKYTHPNFVIFDKDEVRYGNPNFGKCYIFIEIYSKSNVKKLKRKLIPRNINNSVLYIDEKDFRDDFKDEEFIDLCSKVGINIFVSSTT